jgi:hypothetical protein
VDADGTPIQTLPFRLGVSSATVEKMAKQQACTGGQGAALVTERARSRCTACSAITAKSSWRVATCASAARCDGCARPCRRCAAFAIQLALVLLVLLATKPDKAGDFFEYGVTTIALARHGTPDVRAEDAAMAAALSPEAGYRDLFLAMREHIARGEQVPMPGLYGGRDGVYTIHFFAYPALAALPFRLLVEAGAANPFKAFQLVNLGALWLLGLVMFLISDRAAAPSPRSGW